MLRLCHFGPWRAYDAEFLGSEEGEVIRRHYQKRECRHCGRRQERSVRRRASSRNDKTSSPALNGAGD